MKREESIINTLLGVLPRRPPVLVLALALCCLLMGQEGTAQHLIGNNPNISDGGLNMAPPGVWTKVGSGPNARLDTDRLKGGGDGGDWAVGGSDGSGSSAPYDNYYYQRFTLSPGNYYVNVSGWAKAWAGWWSGEDFGWVQEAHIELWIDGTKVWSGMSSNNTNRDTWALWSHFGQHSVTGNIEVRLHSVKNFAPDGHGAIFYDSRFDDIHLAVSPATPDAVCAGSLTVQPNVGPYARVTAADIDNGSTPDAIALYLTDASGVIESYVVENDITSIRVMSSFDGNQIRKNGTSQATLNRGQSADITVAAGDVISGTKPYCADYNGGTEKQNSTLVPKAFAGTEFAVYCSRDAAKLAFRTLGQASTVTIDGYGTNPLPAQQVINISASSTNESAPLTNGAVHVITATAPVLAHYMGGTASDALPLPPADTEIFGVPSGNGHLVFTENGTSYTYYDSNDNPTSGTANAGDRVQIAGVGQGNSFGVRVVADKPVAATSVADGDGSDATAWYPRWALARTFVIPRSAEYFVVVPESPGATITITDAGGSTEITDGVYAAGGAGSGPGFRHFGSTSSVSGSVAAGTRIFCSKPAFVYFEPDDDDEANLNGDSNALLLSESATVTLNAVSTGGVTDTCTAFVTVSAGCTPPNAPTTPGATNITTSAIPWTWVDASSDETGFKVYADPGAGPPTTLRTTTAANVQYWDYSSLTANSQFAFQVASTNGTCDSDRTTNLAKYTLATAPTFGTSGDGKINCDKGAGSTSVWYPANTAFTFTAVNDFGTGAAKASKYRYLWDTTSGNPASWTGATEWTTGTLVKTPTAAGDYYLHLQAANGDDVYNTTTLNLGPYRIDGTAPSVSAVTPSSTCVQTGATISLTANVTDSGSGVTLGSIGLVGANLLTNPSFENGLTGWTNSSSPSYSSSNGGYPNPGTAIDGSRWAATSCSWGSGIQTPELRQAVTVTPGASYFLSAWAYTDGSPNTCSSFLQWKDGTAAGDGECTTVASFTSNTSGWQQLAGFVTPTGSTLTYTLRLSWSCDSSGGGGNFDLAELHGLVSPNTYASNVATWNSVTIASAGGLTVLARDGAGNYSTADSPTINIDDAAPTGTITINGGAEYATSTNVTLTLSASDAGCAGGVQMRFSNDGTSWSAWEAFAATKPWTLSSGDGDKTVYAQYRDALQNTSVNFTDTINLDTTPPTIEIGEPSASATKGGPVTFTVTYGGASTVTLAAGDITLNKTGSADGTVSVSGTGNETRTVTISGITGDGTLGISIAAETASDGAGNKAPSAGPSATFLVDNTGPSVTNVTSNKADGTYGVDEVIDVRVTFSEAVTVSGAEPRILLETGATDRYAVYTGGSGSDTLVFSYTVQQGDQSPDLDYESTAAFDLNGSAICDALGNDADTTLPAPGAAGSLGYNKDIVIETDTTPPTVALSSAVGAYTNAAFTVSAEFSEPVADFADTDITVTNGVVSGFSGSGTSYSWTVTPQNQGAVSVQVEADRAHDAAGNGNTASNTISTTYDSSAPTTTATPAGGLYNADQSVTLSANETATIYYTTNGSEPTTSSSVYSGAISITSDTTLRFFAVDTAGNAESPKKQEVYTIDKVAPTVTVSKASGQADPTNASPVNFTVEFSESVSDFEDGDVTLGGTAGATTAVITGSGTTYRVAVSGMTSDGSVEVSVEAGKAHDAAGNGNTASNTASVAYDGTSPTVTLSSAVGAYTNAAFTVSAEFSEPVADFADTDITVTNGAVSGFSGSGTSYSWTVTPQDQGSVTVQVEADRAHDATGNGNTASNTISTVYDTTAPTIEIGEPSASSTNSGPVTFTVTYGGASSVTLAMGDITLNKTGSADGTISVSGEGNESRTVTISGITGDGTLGISIAPETASDEAGNKAPSAGPSTTFDVDNTAPVITCPDDITVYSGIHATGTTVSWDDIIAVDDRDGEIIAECVPESGSLFAVGTTTVTCTATDSCGNVAECTFDVTVIDKKQADITLELEGVDQGTAFTRWIVFQFGGGGGAVQPFIVSLPVDFANGIGVVTVNDIPADVNWTCVTAKDLSHTLTSQTALVENGVRLAAAFTGENKLLGGDLTNDDLVDILDFGVLVGQAGTNYGGYQPWPARDADITGDGSVWTEDYTYISLNFLKTGDPPCAGAELAPAGIELSSNDKSKPGKPGTIEPQPQSSVTIQELAKIVGMRAAKEADLNGDRIIDTTDMQLFAEKCLGAGGR